MLINLVALQESINAELYNAIDIANESQDAFKFILHSVITNFRLEDYKLPSGAYNISKATYDLIQQRRSLKKLISQNLVFITSYPDSDPVLFNDFNGKSVHEELSQCLFYDREDYPFGSIRLISTYIWEQLPLPENFKLPSSPSGRRALQPFLLLMFTTVALDHLVDISFHEEKRGCPFDYCNDVREIDWAFQKRSMCDEHEQFLKSKVRDNTISKDQYFSFLGLLNRAFGRPSKFKWDVAISFAGSERELAKKLADVVIRAGYKPFYDDYSALDLWGENLTSYLYNVYNKDARFCVIFVSDEYKLRMWPDHERQSAQSRAVQERGKAFILPISIKGARLEDVSEDLAYLDFNKLGLDKIAEILIEKLDP